MQDRIAKLNKRGICAWEVDGVLARLTADQSKNEEFKLRMKPLVEMGVLLAVHMKERFGRGELADATPVPPSDRRGWHKEGANWVPGQVVSEEYAAAAGLPTTTFASSADLHAATGRTGYGNVTGGMLSGLQARGSGQSSVILDFGGSSPGHGGFAVFVLGAKAVGGEGGKPIPVMVRAPETVRNQAKAWVVFSKHGCSPIEPTGPENVAMCEAATAMAQKSVLKQFGNEEHDFTAGTNLDFGGDPKLRDALMRGWVK